MNPAADYPVLPSHYSDETARLGFDPVYLQPPETKTFRPKPKPVVYTPPSQKPVVHTPPPNRPAPVVHSPVVRKMKVVEAEPVKFNSTYISNLL